MPQRLAASPGGSAFTEPVSNMNQSTALSTARRASRVRAAAPAALLGLAVLAGCTVMPTGPTVMALPGSGKSFDQFRADDGSCRQYASQQVGGVTTQQAATTSALGTAAIGTALGAAAGAAFGGGHGAAVGAGAGLLAGGLVGAGNAQGSAYGVQRRYDYAYVQCMYAAGERVPMPRGAASGYRQQYSGPPQSSAPGYYAPPPPPPGAQEEQAPPESAGAQGYDAPPPPPPQD